MGCYKIRKNLDAYIKDYLPEKERNIIKNHLKKCQQCSQEYETLLKLNSYFSLDNVEIKPDNLLISQTLNYVQNYINKKSSFSSLIPRRRTFVYAISLVALIIAFIFSQPIGLKSFEINRAVLYNNFSKDVTKISRVNYNIPQNLDLDLLDHLIINYPFKTYTISQEKHENLIMQVITIDENNPQISFYTVINQNN